MKLGNIQIITGAHLSLSDVHQQKYRFKIPNTQVTLFSKALPLKVLNDDESFFLFGFFFLIRSPCLGGKRPMC